MTQLTDLFSLDGQVAVVTGGTGVLGGAMARGLAQAGAKVGVLGRRREQAEAAVQAIEAVGGLALALPAHVLDRHQLENARETLLARWGRLDIQPLLSERARALNFTNEGGVAGTIRFLTRA